MAVAPVNEPYAKLRDLIHGTAAGMTADMIAKAAAITAIVPAARKGRGLSADLATAHPIISWRNITDGKRADIDVNGFKFHVDRVQFDLWGPDEDTLRHVADLLEDLFEMLKAAEAALDSTNYKFHYLRRDGDWRSLPWPTKQVGEGRILFQRTADMIYSYKFKET